MKLTKKITSLILVAALLMSALAVTAFSAAAATGGAVVYFDNSAYNWENVNIYCYGTKVNAEWPGLPMDFDEETGYYTATFPESYASENVIFNNGDEQYPASQKPGLPISSGECKLLTADLEWIDYGAPDGHGYGLAYTASGTIFSTESINVTLGLKSADYGYYSIDGSPKTRFTEGTVITVGEGKIGNSTVTLELTATGSDGVETTQTYTYKKTFTATQTTLSSPSDGHTTEPETGYYATNPEMQLGTYKTITVDGDASEWDSSMIIAQGAANDDPRVYMPSSMHEQPWDAYALYAAWDDNNLYFMMELANTTYIISPSDDFAASNEARPWRNSIPMYLALSIDPKKQATGKAVGTNLDGSTYTSDFLWGCEGGVAVNGGNAFTTNVDTLIIFDSNNSNGGDSIYKADVLDTDGKYLFNYDTRIPIGASAFGKFDNQNGFQVRFNNGTKSTTLYGINAPKGSRTMGDNTDSGANWVDFFDLGYKTSYGYIYEVGIPLSTLGIDREYIETNGIGAMEILTYGTSGMDSLPHDPSMLDNADVPYSYDESTSHEKEDIDNITVPLARIGALLSDTEVHQAPHEVNFGANLNSGQSAGTTITLSAESYNNIGNVNYEFSVNGKSVQNSSNASYSWTPTAAGTYQISVTATDSEGNVATSTHNYAVAGDGPVDPTTPVDPTDPVDYQLGDVNFDGIITIDDATLVQKYVADLTTFDSRQLAVADTDGDGVITIDDATKIQKVVAELVVM